MTNGPGLLHVDLQVVACPVIGHPFFWLPSLSDSGQKMLMPLRPSVETIISLRLVLGVWALTPLGRDWCTVPDSRIFHGLALHGCRFIGEITQRSTWKSNGCRREGCFCVTCAYMLKNGGSDLLSQPISLCMYVASHLYNLGGTFFLGILQL